MGKYKMSDMLKDVVLERNRPNVCKYFVHAGDRWPLSVVEQNKKKPYL